ncbi:MAG: T9SS type A sorting domain-containing protein [Crocinitomicaceae bacterium]|jgi:hypothetical protein
MKKILLAIIATITLMTSSFAQGVTIFNDPGTFTDISGTKQEVILYESVMNHHLLDFIINNETGSAQSWKITRSILNEPAGWSNFLCWGPNPGIGLCYPANANTEWSSAAEDIAPNGSGKLQTYVTAPTQGSATYRYYVSTDGANFLDSVDVEVNSSLSIYEKPSLTVSVVPNPANSYVSVSANGVNSASVTLVDVLGNIIMKETMSGSKTINISDYKNGIYFFRIESDGVKAITRKIIVRH